MSEPKLGDKILTQTIPEITEDLMTDIRLELINSGYTDEEAEQATAAGTYTYLLMSGVAANSYVNRSAAAASYQDTNPVTCGEASTELWRQGLKLPELTGNQSNGYIRLTVDGTSTVSAGQELVFPNGKRCSVVGTWMSVTDGSEIAVRSIDTGTDTNWPGGTTLRFVNPPVNVSTDATVSYQIPITGGVGAETTEETKQRVTDRLGFAMGGANWAYLRELVKQTNQFVDECYIYPALGGPGSTKIVPTRPFLPEYNEYTRALSSESLSIIRAAIHSYAPGMGEYTVVAPTNTATNVALEIEIPDSTLQGGNGQGWLDQEPWPSLNGDTKVSISAVTSSVTITVTALTTVEPIDSHTRIAWWSPNDMTFHVRTVTSHSGSAGAWVLTVDRPLVDSTGQTCSTGEYISPPAANSAAYGKTWLDVMQDQGPGENVSTTASRRKRHPYISDVHKNSLTTTELKTFLTRHAEITDIDWSYRSLSATGTPLSIDSAPQILVPNHFGVYPA